MSTAFSPRTVPARTRTCFPNPPRSSPQKPSNTQCTTIPNQLSHYDPCCYRRFTWQFIWSLFMRSPRTRSWLFQKQSPDTAHVIHSLLSSPVLLGYVFGSHSEPQPLDFPDIGDLHTVFQTDRDTMLGFHFGFQGIQPIMPMLFQVAKDPLLGNPNVVVRRTAKLKHPAAHCFFMIEMNWCESGVLAVSTSICPIHPSGSRPDGLTPFFDNAELRVFGRTTAERFLSTVQTLEEHVATAHLPTDVLKRVSEFFDPPDDCYVLTVCEPDDPTYHAQLRPVCNTRRDCDQQSFNAENEMANHVKLTNSNASTRNIYPMPRHCDRGNHDSVAEPDTRELWKAYQNVVAQSRRLGIFHTMMEKRAGGRFGKRVHLYGREARYTFLSTSGINAKGRIHRLCSQIGIDYSGPLTDRHLLRTLNADDGVAASKYEGAFADGVERELDLTEPISECSFDWKRRKIFDTFEQSSVGPHQLSKPWAVDEIRSWMAKRARLGESFAGSGQSAVEDPSGDIHDKEEDASVSVYKQRPSQPCIPLASAQQLSALESQLFDNAPAKTKIDSLVTAAEQLEQWTKSSNIDESTVTSEPHKNDSGTLKRRRTQECNVAVARNESSQLSGNTASFCALKPNLSEVELLNAETKAGSTLDSVSNGTATDESLNSSDAATIEKEATSSRPPTTIWTCEICGVKIRGKKGNLNRHIANKHENIRAYACPVPSCGKRFQTRLNLVRHDKAVHQGRPFLCQKCPRTFKSLEHLQNHLDSAHEAATVALACEVCGGCFGRRSTLNRHLSKVHKIDPKTLNAVASEDMNHS